MSFTPPCKGCDRTINREAFERADVLSFSLKRLSAPDKQIKEYDDYLCGPCGEDALELFDEIDEIHPDPKILSSGSTEWWDYTYCGLCGDELAQTRGALYYVYGDINTDEWFYHILCTNCLDIVQTFLESLPEDPRDGNQFYGRFENTTTIKTSVEEADFVAIEETFRDLEVGDQVYFEAHSSKPDHYPDEYAERSGEVFDVNEVNGMPGVFLEPDSEAGEYRMLNLLRRDRSLTVDHVVREGENESLGKVTVLEKRNKGT